MDPTNSLTKLVKTYILYSFCKNINPEYIYMKNENNKYRQRCKAGYPK